jgi:hypothetical protein
LVAGILEQRCAELFRTIELVFLHVIVQELDRAVHQWYDAHFSSLPQEAQLRGWIQSYIPGRKVDQFLHTSSSIIENAQQNSVSAALRCF